MRVGEATLRLCDGPVWHYPYIKRLAPAILEYMVEELGEKETLRRFAHPIWYQAFATVLGFEWQFSGATTVPIRALRETLPDDFPIKVYGGKGKVEIPDEWKHISKETSKFDSAAFQDGYSLYFHVLMTDGKHWVVLNQGMNPKKRLARRYHWSWEGEKTAGKREEMALVFNENNNELKKAVVDIARDHNPEKIEYTILSIKRRLDGQRTLLDWNSKINLQRMPFYLSIPHRINKKALDIARDISNFKELLMIEGLGAATLRGLAYIAFLVYDVPVSWEDPVLFTYAFGTKVGVPYMVDTGAMREAALFFKEAVEEIRIGRNEKKFLLKNIARLVREYVVTQGHKSPTRCSYSIRAHKTSPGCQAQSI